MITKTQKRNAERIKALSDALGHLPYNDHRQTANSVLTISIPLAYLVTQGMVTGIDEAVAGNDGINDNAVADVERIVTAAVERETRLHGEGWWTEEHARLFPPAPVKPLPKNTYLARGLRVRYDGHRRFIAVAVRPEPFHAHDGEGGVYVAFARTIRRSDSLAVVDAEARRYGRTSTGAFAIVIDTTTGEEV